MTDLINPSSVPAPDGGYSHGVAVHGNQTLLFISGQIPETVDGTVPAAFDDQCRVVWDHILAILAEADMSIHHLVQVTTYLTDRAHAERNSEIRRAVLGVHRPALTVVVAQTLDARWMLEIAAVAAKAHEPAVIDEPLAAAEPLNAWDLDDLPIEEIVVLPGRV